MNDIDKKRRNSLLATVAFYGHGVTRELRDELETTHGIAVTMDRVRADLRVLADVGAVRINGDLAQITVEGREHVAKLRELF